MSSLNIYNHSHIAFSLCFLALIFLNNAQDITKSVTQTNLLFIVFDDLRNELTTYGREHMITPNFERLAKRSVVFDNAYCQVAVCNPSRDSMMTGLRPDTTGTYSFQWSFRPHMIFPTKLRRSGYNTAGYGKVIHWDADDKEIWSHGHWDGDWYEYQSKEYKYMNASTQPDKTRPEEWFRDHRFTDYTLKAIRKLHKKPQYFMAAIGFKLPHLAVHVPHKYYAMYKGRESAWRLTPQERQYPPSSPAVAYRCCALPEFTYMNQEGSLRSSSHQALGSDMDLVLPDKMRDELMQGYCGAITFLDKQIGKLLDVVDELNLWNNLTIVLTSDHGIHNGEKGMWEKWTMFDESTRVPLMIHHPASPFQGQHYTKPVELLDIYPTLHDLLNVPYNPDKVCKSNDQRGIWKCLELQGKSLAKVVLGNAFSSSEPVAEVRGQKGKSRGKGRGGKGKGKGKGRKGKGRGGKKGKGSKEQVTEPDRRILMSTNSTRQLSESSSVTESEQMPSLDMDFAITQSWRCASKSKLATDPHIRSPVWFDCSRDDNVGNKGNNQISIMGYSMRTPDFRYTAWLYFNRTSMTTNWDQPPFEEELYDHRGETLKDFTHLELINLAKTKNNNIEILTTLRSKLLDYLKTNIIFHGPYPKSR